MRHTVCCLLPPGPSADILRSTCIVRSDLYSKHFSLEICTNGSTPFGAAIYICPCEEVQNVLSSCVTLTSPIIAYGPAANLSLAIAAGAVDYMRDNWDLEELYFRCMRIIGQSNKKLSWATVFANGNSSLINDVPLALTQGQHRFFEILVSNAGKVLPQEAILCALYIHNPRSRVLSVYASELRHHIAGFIGTQATEILVSCYGQGYLLKA